jgi:hypothetical protein
MPLEVISLPQTEKNIPKSEYQIHEKSINKYVI